jgi:high affinity Mn2+ porin
MSERRKARIALVPVAGAAVLIVPLVGPLAAADLTAVPLQAPAIPEAYDWTGFYAGGHAGYAWGNSDFIGPPGIGGSIGLAQPLDHFDEAGSWFVGVQGGYNYMLPNRMVLGAEVDETAPSFQALNGVSIGGTTTFNSQFGPETYSETVLASGTVARSHRLCAG